MHPEYRVVRHQFYPPVVVLRIHLGWRVQPAASLLAQTGGVSRIANVSAVVTTAMTNTTKGRA